MRSMTAVLAALAIATLTVPALADFPTTTPEWWDPANERFGAAIYDFSQAPDSAFVWTSVDQWIPDPPHEWMTDDPENNFCLFEPDPQWLPVATVGGREGSFAAIFGGETGEVAEFQLGMDNMHDPSSVTKLLVAVDVWIDLADWSTLIESDEILVGTSHVGLEVTTSRWEDAQAGGWRQLSVEVSLDHQPDWEWVGLDFHVPSESFLFLDNVCIASMCRDNPCPGAGCQHPPWAPPLSHIPDDMVCGDDPPQHIDYDEEGLWFATSLSGDYQNDAGVIVVAYADSLYSPFHIGPGGNCPCMELRHWYSAESDHDGGNVKVSEDGGATWTLITPCEGYPGSLSDETHCIPSEPAFTGHANDYMVSTFDLSDFMGSDIVFGFFFGSDSSNTFPGWYVDDVRLCDDSASLIKPVSWGVIKAMYR